MMERRRVLIAVMVFLGSLVASVGVFAQDYGARLGGRRGGEVTFEPRGPGVLFDALDPAVKKWYVPQELFMEYQWKQWEYTNYARSPYERYVDIALEGDYFYDLYGNFVTRGWLIYDWRQDQPKRFGSSLFKDDRFSSWFSRVLIAKDSKGQYHYALTAGDWIRTTLTPMTFSKQAFNGLQFDFLSDKYEATLLMSRVNAPGIGSTGGIPLERTNSTNLMGGRATAQVGDFVKVGATYVSSHQSQMLLEGFSGGLFRGSLSTQQNAQKILQIIVRLSDDSPEDEEGGTALFWDDIIITDMDGNRVRGSDIGFHPIREGGFQRIGYLAADGEEEITLTYDFGLSSYNGPDPSTIKEVTFELVLSNDYKVEMTSDRQTNKDNQPVFLTVVRADGNIKDNTNQRVVRFDYGLPTANEIYGFTLEVNDVLGFDLYGEFDVNRRYRQYPNVNLDKHHTAVTESRAWMVNISKLAYPWFVFGEAFSMDDGYSTGGFVVDDRGAIDYEDKLFNLYEFVEDNDDQDRYPDWQRLYQPGPDPAVFPGWDENNDFISDFNQNDNIYTPSLLPDSEEPFLRYSVDRPEFLFGIDMNNNGWIDRFENDEEPDYPYKRDHRGYNIYFGAHIVPNVRLTIGQERVRLLSEDKRNLTTYALFTLDKDYAGLGRLRIFDNFRLAKDNIPDDLFQWVQPEDSRGTQRRISDSLPARNTWVNTAYLGFDYTGIRDLNVINKIKYEFYDQRDRQPDLFGHSRFLGLISKADYTLRWGDLRIQPRIKNEFRRETPFLKREPERKELTLDSFLILAFPVFSKTAVQVGFEFTHFEQFREDEFGKPLHGDLDPDSNEWIYAIQFSNLTDYLGYRLTTQAGVRLHKRAFENDEKTTSTVFVTLYAGVQD